MNKIMQESQYIYSFYGIFVINKQLKNIFIINYFFKFTNLTGFNIDWANN